MSKLVYRITHLLSAVVQHVPIGTNLGLFHLFWILLSGQLLLSRGAVIPGLAAWGLPDDGVRRAWAALAYGRWEIGELVTSWQQVVVAEGRWVAHEHGGYRPVACDLIGFYRPRLQDCPTKHYSSQAGKALPAIPIGLAAGVGSVGEQRLAIPRLLVRAAPGEASEAALQVRLLEQTREQLAADEAVVTDRGFPLAQVQAAELTRYVARGPVNFTARRAAVPAYTGRGRRPTRGELVRPLPRRRKGKVIPATPPDRVERWQGGSPEQPVTLRAEFWENLVLPTAKPGAATFSTVVVYDPRFAEPLLVNTPLPLTGPHVHAFYRDRWPVEGVPLVAKQLLGAVRQFVFAPESRQRLPELVLLAGSIQAYVAATEPAVPTGFWDRAPKPTAGRLRRVLAQVHFTELPEVPPQLRKKPSPTAHLPKGVLAHRRQKKATAPPPDLPLAA